MFTYCNIVTASAAKIENYDVYLKSLYKVKTLATCSDDQWPPPCTDKVFRLAMIESKEKVRRGHDLDDSLLREKTISVVTNILRGKIPVELKDIFNNVKPKQQKIVLMEGAPGCGKSTLSSLSAVSGHKISCFSNIKWWFLSGYEIWLYNPLAKLLKYYQDVTEHME